MSVPEVILQKYHKLEEVIAKFEEHQVGKEEFLEDSVLEGAVERWLTLGIEAITDIGNFILAEHFGRGVQRYKDIVLELGERGVIPETLAREGAKMVDFRNRLSSP